MTEAPERLEFRSLDIAEEKRQELLRLFPETRTEDGSIDFDRLRLALGDMVDTGRERYGMTWPGKADCFKVIQSPSLGTLLPAPEESVNFDTTEHLLIEGDNFEVLKLLQKSYLGKVKMIYIDPPYNTGNDFIYPDDYSETLQTYLEYTGQVDSEGRMFGTNTDRDGRFHSRWLNMMYPRLYMARNLLRDDGVVFISINDVEVANLKAICNEIFGEECFVAQFVWNNEGNIDNQSKIKVAHEYVLCYSRVVDGFIRPTVIDPNIDDSSKLYRDTITNTIVKNGPANPPSTVYLPVGFPAIDENFDIQPRDDVWPKIYDELIVDNGMLQRPARVQSGWSSRNLLDLFISNGCVPIRDAEGRETRFALTSSGAIYVYKERSELQGHVLSVIRNVGTSKQNSKRLAAWGLEFPYPKPLRLIRYLCEIATSSDPDAIILDFFLGSGTTGHAVIEQNALDGGNRKFVLIQLPEPTGRDDLQTITEIAKQRLRSAAREIDNEYNKRLDIDGIASQDRGFRVFKLAESNFTTWDADAPTDEASLAKQLELHVHHIRDSRGDLDLLYEILLKSGYPLTTSVVVVSIDGKDVHSVADGALLVCLDRALTLDLIRGIAARQPERVVLLDAGFAGNDQLKTNAVHIFKHARKDDVQPTIFRTI